MNGQTSRIVGAGAGIVAALLIFLSLAVVDPLRQATDDELIKWWSTNSNLDDLIVSGYLRLFAMPFLVVFVVQLRNTLRAAAGGLWTDVAYSSGIICAGVVGVSALLRIVLAQSVRLGDEPLPGVDTLRLATDLGLQTYGTLAIFSFVVLVAATAAAVLGHGGLPRWLGFVSVPVAGISLVAVLFQVGAFASPLVLLWLFATSICLALAKTAHEPSQAPVATAITQPANS